jgi:hypothetical protein
MNTAETALAVVICRTAHGTHAGIIHPDGDDRAVVLHLAWHHKLELDDLAATPWRKAVWAAPPVEPETAEALAAICRLIWLRHAENGFPYAFRYVDATFELASGTLVLGPDEIGFTCSTFILGIFKARGIQLLRQGEWEVRPGDEEKSAGRGGLSTSYRRGGGPRRVRRDGGGLHPVSSVRRRGRCSRYGVTRGLSGSRRGRRIGRSSAR